MDTGYNAMQLLENRKKKKNYTRNNSVVVKRKKKLGSLPGRSQDSSIKLLVDEIDE